MTDDQGGAVSLIRIFFRVDIKAGPSSFRRGCKKLLIDDAIKKIDENLKKKLGGICRGC
jgi:hypothetical protein